MSADGRLLAGSAATAAGTLVGVAVYDLDTGQARLVSHEADGGYPRWLPDGRRHVYPFYGRTGEVVVVDVAGGERRVIDVGPFEILGATVVAAPDGRSTRVPAPRPPTSGWSSASGSVGRSDRYYVQEFGPP